MQTFLPYASFDRSAAVLDDRRLGKQRVEADQIARTLLGVPPKRILGDGPVVVGRQSGGWRNHSAVRMWRGYVRALLLYRDRTIAEWIRRGKVHNPECFLGVEEIFPGASDLDLVPVPPWLGSPEVHASHRSNLLRKDPVAYRALGWTESPDLPYVWPV